MRGQLGRPKLLQREISIAEAPAAERGPKRQLGRPNLLRREISIAEASENMISEQRIVNKETLEAFVRLIEAAKAPRENLG